MNILFIAPYPKTIAPSQRFRFEHYLPDLEQLNITWTYKTFVTGSDHKIMFKKGKSLHKAFIVIKGFLRRTALIFTLKKYDVVFVHREASLLGPPVFEWLIAKVWRKKMIYDFDDAIWVPTASAANPIAASIKCAWKVAKICRWSTIVSVGNQYLANYAKQFCNDVRIIPTVVDTEASHNTIKNQDEPSLTIGWTGTFTNFVNLPLVLSSMRRLQEKYTFEFLIIADKDPLLDNIRYTFLKWNKATEITDLLKMNIGIMPLLKKEIQLGKCAFKAIQYMSLGIPAVVSPVGTNCEVVQDKVNGYWADNDEEWYNALEKLLLNTNERFEMGKLAKELIESKYSVIATKDMFINLFRQPAEKI